MSTRAYRLEEPDPARVASVEDILWLDIETTGTDPVEDRIIEFAMEMVVQGARKPWVRRMNPGIPIKPEATEVHGITDADVAMEPPFSAFAPSIHRALKGRHLGGYNLRRLDLPMIDEELRRCKLSLDIRGIYIVDAAAIFFKKEPRALEDAVRKYCGREHAGKHGAGADTDATIDVFLGQLAVYPDLATMPLAQLAEFARMNDRKEADLAGKLLYDDQGKLCYAFGKYKGQQVEAFPGYADWMLAKDFPGSTKDLLREVLYPEVKEVLGLEDPDCPF